MHAITSVLRNGRFNGKRSAISPDLFLCMVNSTVLPNLPLHKAGNHEMA